MAATVSSVWAKPGAWALDSEQHEDELTLQHQLDLAAPAAAAPAAEFPSLSAAVTAKPKKKTKHVLSLAKFSNYKPPSAAGSAAAEVVLPTGPRERTDEEIAESRRGGFRNYGGDREGRPRVSRDGFDGERDMGPSRADEVDDWSKGKKVSSFGPGSGPERERDMGPSRSDGVDDWSKGKKFGSGFGVERIERREKVGFFNSSRADEVDNWGAEKQFGSFGSGSSMGEDRRRERRVGFEAVGPGSDVDSWVKKGSENGGNSGNNGSGGGRPRLNLQPRTLPPAAVVENNDGNVSAGVGEVVKAKGNPFGAARPREEVLKEKGQDWKEIDEKLKVVKIKEKEKEKEKEGERSSFDSIGRRKGFGVGARPDANGGEDSVRSVGAWRKPDSLSYAAVAVAPPRSAERPETTEKTEKAPEDN